MLIAQIECDRLMKISREPFLFLNYQKSVNLFEKKTALKMELFIYAQISILILFGTTSFVAKVNKSSLSHYFLPERFSL